LKQSTKRGPPLDEEAEASRKRILEALKKEGDAVKH